MEIDCMEHELTDLKETLDEIEEAFYLVAAHDSELLTYGLGKLSRWLDLSKLQPSLDKFSIQLAGCLKIVEIFDHKKFEQLNTLLVETKIEELITRFSVKLRIAQAERPKFSPILAVNRVFSILGRAKITSELFTSEDMSMEGALSAIARIKTSLAVITKELNERLDNDDEIFKPSNLDILRITKEIDSAIYSVLESSQLSKTEQSKLIQYLEEAKSELTKKSPAWKKVIGALVITSALLGGVAVLPQAAGNIDKAISYVLGTAVPQQRTDNLNFPKQLDRPIEVKLDPEVFSI
jgi:hypothetical protein